MSRRRCCDLVCGVGTLCVWLVPCVWELLELYYMYCNGKSSSHLAVQLGHKLYTYNESSERRHDLCDARAYSIENGTWYIQPSPYSSAYTVYTYYIIINRLFFLSQIMPSSTSRMAPMPACRLINRTIYR